MARLTESQARRLVEALSGAGAITVPRRSGASPAHDDDAALRKVRALFADAAACDELGRALTLDLASYLKRPVRCSVTPPLTPPATAWRFEASGDGFGWYVDVDVALARAFADAMIGGDGTANVGQGRRVRLLAERVVARMLSVVAAAAGVEAPVGRAPTAETLDETASESLAGGLCAVAAEQYGWQIGIRVTAGLRDDAASAALAPPAAPVPTGVLAPTAAPAPPVASAPIAVPTPHALSAPPSAPDAPRLLEQPKPIAREAKSGDADRVIHVAVAALRAHLQDVLHCQIPQSQPEIAEMGEADLGARSPAALGLALTAGGNGAVVAYLNAEAVAGLAGGAAGGPVPLVEPAGEVVLAAAEAIVRDALADVARRLPGIASDVYRIVRLSDNALPARTAHHAVEIPLAIGGRAGTLQLLVPSWMLSTPTRTQP